MNCHGIIPDAKCNTLQVGYTVQRDVVFFFVQIAALHEVSKTRVTNPEGSALMSGSQLRLGQTSFGVDLNNSLF
ncbi:hypothetical protein PG993_011473 [Apiospora rasikravindrae]|uniref:Uncharacterized protein n=1 Tax=Apiospora rasikravindrae TaxID=990691 RepID=A0ABR1SED2_9PEZI